MKLPHLGMLYDYAASAPQRRAGVLFVIATATIAGAWFTELVLGYVPCKLCLLQRWPYYAAVPLAAFALFISGPLRFRTAARPAFAMLAMIFMISTALGVHHAGVEWGWWLGPADCGGKLAEGPANVGDLMAAMNKTRIVSCTDAPFRILGFSLAGWNALISFILATIAIRGWRAPRPFTGNFPGTSAR
ncbi:MAG: disulfide bond formation protein B [Beijerinckiaceae bacterium]